jgi:hypothetical protein
MDDGHSPAGDVAVFVVHVGWGRDGALIDSARVVAALGEVLGLLG